MSRSKATDKNPHVSKQHTLLFDIPPRFQWDHGNGFCGEMSIQSIGMLCGDIIVKKVSVDVSNT